MVPIEMFGQIDGPFRCRRFMNETERIDLKPEKKDIKTIQTDKIGMMIMMTLDKRWPSS